MIGGHSNTNDNSINNTDDIEDNNCNSTAIITAPCSKECKSKMHSRKAKHNKTIWHKSSDTSNGNKGPEHSSKCDIV